MYEVSAEYLAAFHEPSQRWKIRGTVGNVSFTEANILTGSLSFSGQGSDNTDIIPGMAAIGEMSATFLDVNIPSGSWRGKLITIEIGLTLADRTVEWVPNGVYKIEKADWSLEGVSVTAYDAMQEFDQPFTVTDLAAGTGDVLFPWICQKCNVLYGMQSLSGFCNDNMTFVLSLTQESDIKTYRDLIYWAAQCMCAFATIDRHGALVLRSLNSDPVDTVGPDERFASVSFSDYQTNYAGITVENEDGAITYYGSQGAGTTINLGKNPFLQRNANTWANNLAMAVQQIHYVPFSAEMLGGVHFDLGDVLTQNGGLGKGARCIILAYDYTVNKSYSMEGFGANPLLATAQSKADKNIQSLVSRVDADSVQFSEYSNLNDIIVGPARTQVARLRFATKRDARIKFTAEIRLTSEADVETLRTICRASYELNYEEIHVYPTETWDQDEDGEHILTLMWLISAGAGQLCFWDVFLECLEGQVTITSGNVSAYLEGFGLVGDGEFGGYIEAEDTVDLWEIIEVSFLSISDDVSIVLDAPTTIAVADTAGNWDLVEIGFESVDDDCDVQLHLNSFTRITEDGNTRITEDGIIRVTEGD
jgi:hypothetical protein